MTIPRRHHYIPRSYLKNFAFQKGEEYYVHVRYKNEKFYDTNITNICSESYFYSNPNGGAKHNVIEHFYANEIDAFFPEITRIVTDDSITSISEEQRFRIVSATLSLYFRTPKFLNAFNAHQLELLEELRNYSLGTTENHTINFFGKKIDFKQLSFESVQEQIVKENKLLFLKEHLQIFNDLLAYRLDDAIGIQKLVDDSEYITCDNPVIIRNSQGNLNNIFDDDNIIILPINNKYKLTIFPPRELDIKNTFGRITGNIIDALTTNVDIENYSEKWIIGSEKSITKHIDGQNKYNELTPENLQMVDNLKKKALTMNSVWSRIERIGITHPRIIKELKELAKDPEFSNDSNFLSIAKQLNEKGYPILD